MAKVIKDDIIGAGIDKRIKDLIEPRIGAQAYKVTRSLFRIHKNAFGMG